MDLPEIAPDERVLKLRAVRELAGKGRSSIYADPTFPKPLKLGPRSSGWLRSEVLRWIAQRAAARK